MTKTIEARPTFQMEVATARITTAIELLQKADAMLTAGLKGGSAFPYKTALERHGKLAGMAAMSLESAVFEMTGWWSGVRAVVFTPAKFTRKDAESVIKHMQDAQALLTMADDILRKDAADHGDGLAEKARIARPKLAEAGDYLNIGLRVFQETVHVRLF